MVLKLVRNPIISDIKQILHRHDYSMRLHSGDLEQVWILLVCLCVYLCLDQSYIEAKRATGKRMHTLESKGLGF